MEIIPFVQTSTNIYMLYFSSILILVSTQPLPSRLRSRHRQRLIPPSILTPHTPNTTPTPRSDRKPRSPSLGSLRQPLTHKASRRRGIHGARAKVADLLCAEARERHRRRLHGEHARAGGRGRGDAGADVGVAGRGAWGGARADGCLGETEAGV